MTKPQVQTSDTKLQKKVIRNEEECVWPQICAILTGSLASFTDGSIGAWTSPFLVKIVEDKHIYNISETEASTITVIQPLVLLLTCLPCAMLCDIIGRKKSLLLISLPQILSLITSAVATNIYMFYLSRAFSGLSVALLWSALPMYIGEVASPKVRGVWGNSITSSVLFGFFVMNVIGSYFNIVTTSLIFMPIPVLFLILFSFMPESPYFYFMRQNYEGAEKSLQFLTRKSNIDDDFDKLKKDVERQMSESGTWKDLVVISSNRQALLAGFFLRMSQQGTGLGIFGQYTQFIFKKAGGDVSPQIASIITTALCLILNLIVVIFIIDKFSRKLLYTISLAFCSIILLILSAYFYVDEIVTGVDMSCFNWIPLVDIILYQIFSSFGVGVIPSLMTGELFSASIKSKGMTSLMIFMAAGGFLTNYIFNYLNSTAGSYAPFMLFTISTVISVVLSIYLIPNTKGKTLEEIQMSLKSKKLDKSGS